MEVEMKPFKPLLLSVAMIVAVAFPGLAAAQDHPSNEHPASSEHPSKAEHPGKTSHADDGVLAKAAADGRFTKFVAAVEAAGLSERLQGNGPYTIFAPTDEAFARLPEGALADLMKPANRALLVGLIGNHVVPGKLSADAFKNMKATNIDGHDLVIKSSHKKWTVDGVQVIGDELEAGNGVIHVVDAVLVPSKPVEHPEKAAPKDHPGH